MALKDLYQSAKQTAWANAETQLKTQLTTAEIQLLNYSKNLPPNPEASIDERRNAIAAKRAELWAQAITQFHETLFPIEAEQIAAALITYLNAQSQCLFQTGSLIAPSGGGTVVPTSPVVAIIQYE